MEILKKYRGLNVEHAMTEINNEVAKLDPYDPRYAMVQSGIGNAIDTLSRDTESEVYAAARAYLKDSGSANFPEVMSDLGAYELAVALIAHGTIQGNTCQPDDFGATAAHIRWFQARGFRG